MENVEEIIKAQSEFHERMLQQYSMDEVINGIVVGVARQLVETTETFNDSIELSKMIAQALMGAVEAAANEKELKQQYEISSHAIRP